MPITYGIQQDLTCGTCGETFPATLWLTVDAQERPDLWEYCREGRIHTLPCNRGHINYFAVPLLLHDPATQTLIFCTIPGADQQEMKSSANRLMLRLHAQLPPGPIPQYLLGCRVVDRDTLTEALPPRVAPPTTPPPLHRSVINPNVPSVKTKMEQFLSEGNFAEAAQMAQLMLLVNTPERNLQTWIWLQGILTDSLIQANPSARRENIRKAIQTYESALALDKTGEFGAQIYGSLGDLHTQLGNSTKAIECFRAAIRPPHSGNALKPWLSAQIGLAQALVPTTGDFQPSNLDEAITSLSSAQSDVDSATMPELWVRLQITKGNVLSRQDATEAIKCYEAALQVATRTSDPRQWAILQFNIGTALSDIPGNPVENRDKAIDHHRAALSEIDPQASPELWARVHVGLATAYLDRLSGSTEENLSDALHNLDTALTVYTPERYPLEWAIAQFNIGRTFLNRWTGSRDENQTRAVAAFEAARTVLTKDSDPARWIVTTLRLAESHAALAERHPDPHARLAAEIYRDVLPLLNGSNDNVRAATTQAELAKALLRSRQNPDEIEPLFQSATAKLTNPADRTQLATVQNSYAVFLLSRSTNDDIENALQLLQSAESAYDKASFAALAQNGLAKSQTLLAARDWVLVTANLATAYSKRKSGVKSANLQRAAEIYTEALAICTPEFGAVAARSLLMNLIQTQLELGQWDNVYRSVSTALEAARREYSWFTTEEDRQRVLTEQSILFERAVEACLRIHPPRHAEAFERAEEARAHLFRDQMGELALPPLPDAPPAVMAIEADLVKQLRNLNRNLAQTTAPESRSIESSWIESKWIGADQSARIRRRLESLWDTLTEQHHAAAWVAFRRGTAVTWTECRNWLQTLSPRTLMVQFFSLPETTIAFVGTPAEDAPTVLELPIPRSELEQLCRSTAEAYRHPSLAPPTDELARRLLSPLRAYIENADACVLIPHGPLHGIPLHALTPQSTPVIYSPAMSTLIRLEQSAPSTSTGSVAAGDPDATLPYADLEAQLIARRLSIQPLTGPAAARSPVLTSLETARIAHLATHAWFNPTDPFGSGILLADNEVLTARDITQSRAAVHLLVLSACESGKQQVAAGDELTGLARAFLYSGVRSMLLTQWPVADLSTLLVMENFYENLLTHNLPGPKALNQAQHWLRTITARELTALFRAHRTTFASAPAGKRYVTCSEAFRKCASLPPDSQPYAHPYYWAPFIWLGLPFSVT